MSSRRRKKKKKKKKKHGTIHHILPQGREGPKEPWNEQEKKPKIHQAWHTFFFDGRKPRLPCEAINYIDSELITKSGYLDKTKLNQNKIEAWETLFGADALPKKAIQIIKQDWTLKWCFQFEECVKFHNPEKICPVLKLYKEGKI